MTDKKQIDKFREMAKELECDESEKAFDKKLASLTSKNVNVSKSIENGNPKDKA